MKHRQETSSATQLAPPTRSRVGARVVIGAVVVLLVWLAVGGIGGQFIGKLSGLQKNDNASFLPASADSTKVAAAVATMNKGASLPMIVVVGRDAGLTQADLGKIGAFAQALPSKPVDTSATDTVSTFLATPKAIMVPSADGKAALVILSLANDKLPPTADGKSPITEIAASVRANVANDLTPTGLTAHVTGPGGYIADLAQAFSGIDGILLGVTLGVVLIILLIVYRSPVLPFAVLLTSVFGLAAAGLVVYQVADRGWITVSGQSQGILSILVVGAATDYALLLVSRYKEELHHRESTWEALKIAWRASIEPICASAFTVILGLLALMLADLKSTSGLGPVTALGIIGALLAATTFLPAILVLGRRWIFWPAIPRLVHKHDQSAETGKPRRFTWRWVAALVGRHPRRVYAACLVVLLGMGAFLPTLRSNGIPQSSFFLRQVDSVAGQKMLSAHFDAGSGSPLQIIAPQADAERVVALLKTEAGISNPYIGQAPGTPPQVVDGNVLVQATLTDQPDGNAAIDTVKRLRTDVRTISPDVLVGGETAQALDTRTAADRDFKVVVPTIIAVVFVILALLLRSLMAAALLIAVNIVSFAATMGGAALVFNHVFKFAGGDPTTVLYGFVFLVALGVDYSIFLMSRAREESKTLGTREGVLRALTVTGGVITSAGVVLAATFGALAVVPLLFLAQIAFIVAFGVLIDTLVVRSLLVPSLSLELGRWTWWPSKLWRAEKPG